MSKAGLPPFRDMEMLIEAAGYSVVFIEAEYKDQLQFTGAIVLKIIPADAFPLLSTMSFPAIPRDLISQCRVEKEVESEQVNGCCLQGGGNSGNIPAVQKKSEVVWLVEALDYMIRSNAELGYLKFSFTLVFGITLQLMSEVRQDTGPIQG